VQVRNLEDLAIALRANRPGDEVELEWARAGGRTTARATLEERR
jgi:S1-C subfamily serine protease